MKARRRLGLVALAVVVGSTAIAGSLPGQARASGSAAQDQYTPRHVAKPAQGQGPLTPPGAQAQAAGVAGQSATLPFTGLSLLGVVVVGAGLLLLGILLRRGLPRRGP